MTCPCIYVDRPLIVVDLSLRPFERSCKSWTELVTMTIVKSSAHWRLTIHLKFQPSLVIVWLFALYCQKSMNRARCKVVWNYKYSKKFCFWKVKTILCSQDYYQSVALKIQQAMSKWDISEHLPVLIKQKTVKPGCPWHCKADTFATIRKCRAKTSVESFVPSLQWSPSRFVTRCHQEKIPEL